MFVKMIWNDDNERGAGEAWYRKLGYCFDFMTDKAYASDLTEAEANRIVDNAAYYTGLFGADEMKVELF